MRRLSTSHPFYSKVAHIVIAIIGLGYLVITGKLVLCPLLFSFLFAILILPLCQFFERKLHVNRGIASALSVLALLCFIAAILYLVSYQAQRLSGNWPVFKQELSNYIEQLKIWSISHFNKDLTEEANKTIVKLFSSGDTVVSSTILSVSSIFLFVIFVIVDTFFLLFYRHLFLQFFVSLVKQKEDEPVVYHIVSQVQHTMRKYLIGLLVEMFIVTVTCSLAFWAIGIKYPLLLGLITGLFNIIPYAGIFTALLINIFITLAMGSAAKIILVIIAVVLMHLIDSNILLPFIVGAQVRINALITILGLTMGGMTWGIPGMFLSIPTIAIIKIICDHVYNLKSLGLLLGDEKAGQRRKKNEGNTG